MTTRSRNVRIIDSELTTIGITHPALIELGDSINGNRLDIAHPALTELGAAINSNELDVNIKTTITIPVSHTALTELGDAINSNEMDVNLKTTITVPVSHGALTELEAAINLNEVDVNVKNASIAITNASLDLLATAIENQAMDTTHQYHGILFEDLMELPLDKWTKTNTVHVQNTDGSARFNIVIAVNGNIQGPHFTMKPDHYYDMEVRLFHDGLSQTFTFGFKNEEMIPIVGDILGFRVSTVPRTIGIIARNATQVPRASWNGDQADGTGTLPLINDFGGAPPTWFTQDYIWRVRYYPGIRLEYYLAHPTTGEFVLLHTDQTALVSMQETTWRAFFGDNTLISGLSSIYYVYITENRINPNARTVIVSNPALTKLDPAISNDKVNVFIPDHVTIEAPRRIIKDFDMVVPLVAWIEFGSLSLTQNADHSLNFRATATGPPQGRIDTPTLSNLHHGFGYDFDFTIKNSSAVLQIQYGFLNNELDDADTTFVGFCTSTAGTMFVCAGSTTATIAQVDWNRDKADGTGMLPNIAPSASPSPSWGDILTYRVRHNPSQQTQFYVQHTDTLEMILVHEQDIILADPIEGYKGFIRDRFASAGTTQVYRVVIAETPLENRYHPALDKLDGVITGSSLDVNVIGTITVPVSHSALTELGDAINSSELDVNLKTTITVPVSHAALTELGDAINSSELDVNLKTTITVPVSHAALTELGDAINFSELDVNVKNTTIAVAMERSEYLVPAPVNMPVPVRCDPSSYLKSDDRSILFQTKFKAPLDDAFWISRGHLTQSDERDIKGGVAFTSDAGALFTRSYTFSVPTGRITCEYTCKFDGEPGTTNHVCFGRESLSPDHRFIVNFGSQIGIGLIQVIGDGGFTAGFVQTNWNVDKADGTGTLPNHAWTSTNRYKIEMESAYTGISFYIQHPTTFEWVLVHQYLNRTSSNPSGAYHDDWQFWIRSGGASAPNPIPSGFDFVMFDALVYVENVRNTKLILNKKEVGSLNPLPVTLVESAVSIQSEHSIIFEDLMQLPLRKWDLVSTNLSQKSDGALNFLIVAPHGSIQSIPSQLEAGYYYEAIFDIDLTDSDGDAVQWGLTNDEFSPTDFQEFLGFRTSSVPRRVHFLVAQTGVEIQRVSWTGDKADGTEDLPNISDAGGPSPTWFSQRYTWKIRYTPQGTTSYWLKHPDTGIFYKMHEQAIVTIMDPQVNWRLMIRDFSVQIQETFVYSVLLIKTKLELHTANINIKVDGMDINSKNRFPIDTSKSLLFEETFSSLLTTTKWPTLTITQVASNGGVKFTTPSTLTVAESTEFTFPSDGWVFDFVAAFDLSGPGPLSELAVLLESTTGSAIGFSHEQTEMTIETPSQFVSQTLWNFDKADGSGDLPVLDYAAPHHFRVCGQTHQFAIRYFIMHPTTHRFVLVHLARNTGWENFSSVTVKLKAVEASQDMTLYDLRLVKDIYDHPITETQPSIPIQSDHLVALSAPTGFTATNLDIVSDANGWMTYILVTPAVTGTLVGPTFSPEIGHMYECTFRAQYNSSIDAVDVGLKNYRFSSSSGTMAIKHSGSLVIQSAWNRDQADGVHDLPSFSTPDGPMFSAENQYTIKHYIKQRVEWWLQHPTTFVFYMVHSEDISSGKVDENTDSFNLTVTDAVVTPGATGKIQFYEIKETSLKNNSVQRVDIRNSSNLPVTVTNRRNTGYGLDISAVPRTDSTTNWFDFHSESISSTWTMCMGGLRTLAGPPLFGNRDWANYPVSISTAAGSPGVANMYLWSQAPADNAANIQCVLIVLDENWIQRDIVVQLDDTNTMVSIPNFFDATPTAFVDIYTGTAFTYIYRVQFMYTIDFGKTDLLSSSTADLRVEPYTAGHIYVCNSTLAAAGAGTLIYHIIQNDKNISRPGGYTIPANKQWAMLGSSFFSNAEPTRTISIRIELSYPVPVDPPLIPAPGSLAISTVNGFDWISNGAPSDFVEIAGKIILVGPADILITAQRTTGMQSIEALHGLCHYVLWDFP